MYNSHDVHFHEHDYIKKVQKYLSDAYGKTINDLALSVKEIAIGLHDNLHPTEFVDQNAKDWGIHILPSWIPGTAKRVVLA